jgi:hypothetical protein
VGVEAVEAGGLPAGGVSRGIEWSATGRGDGMLAGAGAEGLDAGASRTGSGEGRCVSEITLAAGGLGVGAVGAGANAEGDGRSRRNSEAATDVSTLRAGSVDAGEGSNEAAGLSGVTAIGSRGADGIERMVGRALFAR